VTLLTNIRLSIVPVLRLWLLLVTTTFAPFVTFGYGGHNQTNVRCDSCREPAVRYDGVPMRITGETECGTPVNRALIFKLADLVAAERTAPRFLVTESGVAVPTDAAELRANMQLLQDTSTSPATSRKFVGVDSQGPLRVRIEQAHPETPGYTGPVDPLHTVDHLHIDRRLNGTTGPWQSTEKLPYDWP
jgi:hypothetical protein